MKNLFLAILFLFAFTLVAYDSDLNNFTHISPNLSDHNWIDERIITELENIPSSSIKKQDIDKVLTFAQNRKANDTYYLIKISISNNFPKFTAESEAIMNHRRSFLIKEYFYKLCQKYKLPNMELLFSLGDELDCLPESVSNSYKDIENLQIPIFVFAKNTKSKSRILFPDFEAFNADQLILDCELAKNKHPWENKKEKVFFRGITTNKRVTIKNFMENPRFRIVQLSQQNPSLIDAAFTYVIENYKDFPSNICVMSPYVSMQDHFVYKYLIDIDGNSCTYSRCRWIMLSNSVLLKCESDNIQWYYDLLIPYENYIPIKKDFSDLQSQIAWLETHDKEAREISRNASALGKEIFNSQSVELYAVKLLNEYAKCFDSESLKK